METKNDNKKHPVGKDEVEAGRQGNPADGSSVDSCRDCTGSTHVGSIPPPNNENNTNVQISTTDMPDSDAICNNTASSLDRVDPNSLIADSSRKDSNTNNQDSEATTSSKAISVVNLQPPRGDTGEDTAKSDKSCKPLSEEVNAPTNVNSNQPSQSSPTFATARATPAVVNTEVVTKTHDSSTKLDVSSAAMLQHIAKSSLHDSEVNGQNQTIESLQANSAPLDESTIIDDAVRALRAPLVDMYSPFIEPCDTSLASARARLRTAIEQTRQLRAAFSDRVYDKYRVCLRPPPSTQDILNGICADPVGVSAKLQEETRKLNEEKEAEKKEAHELSAQWAAANINSPSVAASMDAEQFMYVTAGLSLVVLPEQEVDDIDMSRYQDRAPIDSETGQRVRSISVAAAAAGELIIDRARKGATSIQDRQQRHHIHQLPGEEADIQNRINIPQLSSFPSVGTDTFVAPPSSFVAATKPPVKSPPTKIMPVVALQPSAVAAATIAATQGKSNRARAPPTMSANNLLSISPASDELRPSSKISAATAALIAKGVGCSTTLKSPQQRCKHPHPDSLGGRRQSQSLKNYAAYLSISLPTVPTSKELRDAKVLSIVDTKVAGTRRAVSAIQEVISQFVCNSSGDVENQGKSQTDESYQISCDSENRINQRKRKLTEIGLLQRIQRIGEHRSKTAEHDPTKLSIPPISTQNQDNEKMIDPILTFCVLQAVGLVRKPRKIGNSDLALRLDTSQVFEPATINIRDGNSPLVEKLRDISKSISSRKRTFSEAFMPNLVADEINVDEQIKFEQNNMPSSPCVSPRLKGAEPSALGLVLESPSVKSVESCPVESLRGGGDVLLNSPGDGSAKDELQNALTDKPSNERDSDQEALTSEPSITVTDGRSHASLSGQLDAMTMQLSGSSQLASFASQGVVWEEHGPQAISLMNTHIPLSDEIYTNVAANSGVIPQQRAGGFLGPQPSGEHYLHRPAASALQLAHQLRHSTVSIAGLAPQGPQQPGASDLSEYIGSLHSTQARAYDWSSLGAAAMAASMGLTPHHTALSVPDQARLLFSREQQNAVAQAQAAAAHRHAVAVRGATTAAIPPHLLFNGVPSRTFSSQPASRFAHLGAQSAASAAAFLTSSNGSRKVGRTEATPQLKTSSLRSDVPGEQPSQKSQSRSKKGSIHSEGSTEEKSSEERSKDCMQQNNNHETHTMRKRKIAEGPDEKSSSVEKQSEPHDGGKRRKVACPDVSSGDSNGATVTLARKDLVLTEASEPAANSIDTRDSPPFGLLVPPKADVVGAPVSEDKGGSSGRIQQTEPNIQASSPHVQGNAMQFVMPPVPNSLPHDLAELVRCGRFHEAVESTMGRQEDLLIPLRIALIEYLVSLGANIPIPKALVSHPLKDRLSAPVFKISGSNGTHPILREVIVATILVYLWTQHEESFQRAFAVNGRIDVDPCCKWLIQAAIDASTRALTIEIADAAARGGPMALAIAGQGKASTGDNEPVTPASARLDVLIASTTSRSLMNEFEIDVTMDFGTQAFGGLVEYLDECRLCALRCKSRERVLLAAIVSRRTTMSESFSHAYTSAMVRAGLALGPADLFESVQNDSTMTSTMIPFDIIEDENGLWEDPCRPLENVSQLLTGDDLMKRAHARAMIQKSLKKLQDRHHLKGGVPRSGPYADPVSTDNANAPGGATKGASGIGQISHHQRGWSKRRTSSFSEPPVPPGTGSAEATSKSLYDPRHYSAPLMWLVDDVENAPYGRQNPGVRPTSIAPTPNFFRGADFKRPQKEKTLQSGLVGPNEGDSGPRRSTCEIDWADVAGIFQQVSLPGTSPGKRDVDETPKAPERDPKSIIAPFCRKVEEFPEVVDEDDESSEDEDLSEEEILKRHQVVLDRMKQRLNAFFETRKKAQQRRKTNKTRA